MLLPQTKEREYRFKLALRMGLPIFALLLALIFHTVIKNSQTLQLSFYLESLIVLVFSIYFILYLIYNGFDVKITDDVSKTFTREYLYKYLKNQLKADRDYTLILISIENLQDINTLYGIKNGDKVLRNVAAWVAQQLKDQNIENFPLGHLKGGDFLIGLPGEMREYSSILELICLKASEYRVDDIEIKLSSAITETAYSRDIDYLIERLFELQEERRSSRESSVDELMSPNELEASVINAIDKHYLSIMTQDVYVDEESSFTECFVKLVTPNGKLLYPKSFMKIINKFGLGLQYDLMVIKTLLYQAKTDKHKRYALNISPTSLRNEKFLQSLKELLSEATVELVLILNEMEYYSHISRYNNILARLHRAGVLIAIDRLGSVHTSFLYLRELDIDFVRLDSYYSNMKRLEENRAIIEGFSLMAHSKDVKSWMKNISDHQTLVLAKEYGVDCLQGKVLAPLKLIYEKNR